MKAYYNEIDPYAAQWLRNLIEAGHIAPGDVDERSIEDVTPKDLHGYTQCHFFAGIGVWSHALRKSGWADDRPVWTGSCPCQPFSAAGKGGGFDDERHLWPAFHHLIRVCRPPIVIGEQVASKDGLTWLDLVSSDMEGEGYAFGAVDTCAAGVGAPHIRQRLYWVADSNDERCERQQDSRAAEAIREGMESAELGEQSGPLRTVSGSVADAECGATERRGFYVGAEAGSPEEEAREWERVRVESGTSEYLGGVADAQLPRGTPRGPGLVGASPEQADGGGAASLDAGVRGVAARSPSPGPTNGHWRTSDWIHCRDGKWRPVEPSTFPLAHGATARVGRLRAYGNAIVAQQAQVFIEAVMNNG